MKAYIVTATINGGKCYLLRNSADGKNPVMQGGVNDIFTATVFQHEQDALNTIDELKHGVGKLANVVAVEIADAPAS